MRDFRSVIHIVGLLLCIEAIAMIIPLLTDLLYNNPELEKVKIDQPDPIEPKVEKEDNNSEEIKVSELKMEADDPKVSHSKLPDGRVVETKGNFKYLK